MSDVMNITGKKIKIIKNLKKVNKRAFVYLDPPYYPIKKNGKISPYKLYNGDFLPVDFLKLKLHCDELTLNGIPFILSNSDCEFIRLLFKEYPIIDVDEPRGMKSGKGKGSRPKEKCLFITNFEQKDCFMKAINKMNNLIMKNGNKR